VRVQPYEPSYLPQLLELVNLHIAAAVPGWALSGAFLAEHLERDYTEPITDPWVEERATLCAVDGGRVLAAAHLLRYGLEVSDHYRGAGEIDWFVALPGLDAAATGVLAGARECLETWKVKKEYGWSHGLPSVPMWGVPDSCSHVAEALFAAGYRPPPHHHPEALYGGRLDGAPAPADPPVAGLAVRRSVGLYGTRFSATLDGEELGFCEVVPNLTRGGTLPALRGWAELQEIWIKEDWRGKGIGSQLVRHAAAWLRLAGCERLILCVASPDEEAGAGRFYRRFGWEVLVREARPCATPSAVVESKEDHA
jgi:GNAT superfamily N-acetyltransferase